MVEEIKNDLRQYANPEKAKLLSGFFKTGKWQYWEWDKFLWVMVPQTRFVVVKYLKKATLSDIEELLRSEFHEDRLVWALILTEKMKKWDEEEREFIYDFYIKNAKRMNNWDFVDLSAPTIVGWFLQAKTDREILYRFVRSDNLWERRISVLATFAFIKNGDFEDVLRLSRILLDDKHDLMHKAVWWMLRELGKKDVEVLKKFLDENISKMPRTMLRYSIEKFPEEERKGYLKR
jgi:3-methyladenine DNA glycosylase AlkD